MTSQEYDIIIRGSDVVDGSGRPPFHADIAILGDRIAAIGALKGDSRTEVDGRGLVAAPGFIDPHTHADSAILRHPLAPNFIMQGVTTVVAGHCGESMAPLKDRCSAVMVNAWEWWRKVRPDEPSYPPTLPLDEYGDLIAEKVGFSIDWSTFGGFLDKVESVGTAVNFASLVGHNTLRTAVMGSDFKRVAAKSEIGEMEELLRGAMNDGAFGLSTMTDPGLGEYADVEELTALAAVTKEEGGCLVPHTRHTQSQWPSLDGAEMGYGIYHGPIEDVWVGRYRGTLEAIEIARSSGVKLNIAHLSNVFRITQPHPDHLEEAMAAATLEVIDAALEDGVDVTFDVVASADCISTGVLMRSDFEEWLEGYEGDALNERLRSEEFREEVKTAHRHGRLKLQMIHTMADPYWMINFRVLRCSRKEFEGEVVGDIANRLGRNALDFVLDVLADDPETIWVQFRDERGTEAANTVFLSHRLAMPCSDAEVYGLDAPAGMENAPPPTAYGLFPHYIRLMVNERKALTIEDAVNKATGLVAERMNIEGRGILEKGAFADIIIFDKTRISETGGFLEPCRRPAGIESVIVNGRIVYRNQELTLDRPGAVLRL
ncbi:MAG: amidohydrolase family protein [Methanobacteriota archaeon]|nr:MAG: amidohydrolase family protein [Euryarchaeota archaeon]